MRIVAGRFRGRLLSAPKGTETRPTTDRVREALMSSLASLLGPDLGGGRALDAFAGSGALGLEALSRGVERVTFVEKHRGALSALGDNVAALGVNGECRIVAGDAFSLAARGALAGPFALILLDPPYRLDQSEVAGLLASLASQGAVSDEAHVVWEHAAGTPAPWPEGFSPVVTKTYGDTAVEIAVYEEGEGNQ